MQNYFAFFPEKCDTELRTVTFTCEGIGGRQIPPGIYSFAECFCTDRQCDCQRVLIKVIRRDTEEAAPSEVATISYTWVLNPKDRSWVQAIREMPNPFLDPLHHQEWYATDLMEFWQEMLRLDPAYLERIKRHYFELRCEFGARVRNPPRPVLTPAQASQERRDRRKKLDQIKRQRKAR